MVLTYYRPNFYRFAGRARSAPQSRYTPKFRGDIESPCRRGSNAQRGDERRELARQAILAAPRIFTDDQRAMVNEGVRGLRSAIARKERAEKAGKAGGVGRPKNSLWGESAHKLTESKPERTRTEVSNAANIPERKVRLAQEVKKAAPQAAEMVRAGTPRKFEVSKV